jgi:aldehyde:ferredoxin oxidoreductase
MPFGHTGKALEIDLDSLRYEEKPIDNRLYRLYMGGSCLAAHYMLKQQKPGTDAFSPDNLLIFSAGVVTGAPVPGAALYSVVSKSPLTGRIHESPTPGYLGERIKKAGFDIIVVKGKAKAPVVLFVHDGKVDFVEAQDIWGLDTASATDRIKEKLGKETSVGVIGIAGENLVRYASIVNDYIFNTSRGGLGAVMGSKHVKALAVSAHNALDVYDKGRLTEFSKRYKNHFLENPVSRGHYEGGGAAGFTEWLSNEGLLSARNAHHTFFREAKSIDGRTITDTYGYENISCVHCFGGCKRVLKTEIEGIDRRYGAPELETLASIACGSEISDLPSILKACELTSRYGLDGTSTGAVLSFINECYEEGVVGKDDVDGLPLGFGNGEGLVPLIEKIAKQEGIGNLLADGVKVASEKIGDRAKPFALQVKGMEVSTHDPRTKAMLGLGYAVNPNGPVYTAVEHDTDFDFNAPELFMKKISPLTVMDRLDASYLGPEKVRMFYLLQPAFSMLDAVGVCIFAFSPVRYFDFRDLVGIVDAITGRETSLFELFKVGERRLDMFRAFNIREGYSPSDDTLPGRYFAAIESGPKKGIKLDHEQFEEAKRLYYRMAGWDEKTGWPAYEKLLELGVEWLEELK